MTQEDARYYLRSSGFSEEQIGTIEQALSQEPKEWSEMLVMCDNCGHAIHIKNEDYEQEPCDAVSRQATIEAFQMFRGYEANRTNAEWVDRIETVVKKLPSVKPQEPKTGHREYNDIYDHYLCGNCKTVVMDYDNYCPNCGADMRGEKNG